MPSPKSGTAGSLVAPTDPQPITDADDAKGGQTSDASNSGSKSGSAPSSVLVKPMATHKPGDGDPSKTSWIALQLTYESNGLPVSGMAYEVTLPDGQTIAGGSTDEKGYAKVDGIDPGSCQISFPSLDKEAWADA